MKSSVFIEIDPTSWEAVDEKVESKVLVYTKDVMLVKVAFEKGGIGANHQHHHIQIANIESGIFEV